MKKRLKINGIIIFCVFLLVAVFPDVFFRKDKFTSFNASAKVTGIAFILLGQMLRVSGRGFKSEYSRNGSLLIQGGPYTLVRNPMYLGILLIGLGIILALFKWWLIYIFLSVFITRYLMLTFKEEKKLSALFAKDYGDYCKRVPRLLPSINTVLNMDIVEYLPMKLAWIKKEIGPISAVLMGVFFVMLWQDFKHAGLDACLKDTVIIIATVTLFIGLGFYLTRRTEALKKDVSNKS